MLLIDGHVHLEHQDLLPELLDNCLSHMRKVNSDENGEPPVRGVLFLAELPEQSWRPALWKIAKEGKSIGGKTPWSLRLAGSKNVIVSENGNGDQLVCFTGQQVITAEKLELLLFGHDEPYSQESLLRSVEKSVNQGSLVVVPWGVGKWLGERGEKVLELLQHTEITGYFLGDNGNRPAVWKNIPQFDLAREKGIPIVAGTDPLFLPGQISRVGGYGMLVPEETAHRFSVPEIVELLRGKRGSIKPYGTLQSLSGFVFAQIALRLKRTKRK